jgi:metal-dependent amidase/aminoacylase/carboxypeptidase family protein
MRDGIVDELKAYEPELIEIRRDIHRHPETGFEETRTAKIVADRLRS